jgi:hypothetical protein
MVNIAGTSAGSVKQWILVIIDVLVHTCMSIRDFVNVGVSSLVL